MLKNIYSFFSSLFGWPWTWDKGREKEQLGRSESHKSLTFEGKELRTDCFALKVKREKEKCFFFVNNHIWVKEHVRKKNDQMNKHLTKIKRKRTRDYGIWPTNKKNKSFQKRFYINFVSYFKQRKRLKYIIQSKNSYKTRYFKRNLKENKSLIMRNYRIWSKNEEKRKIFNQISADYKMRLFPEMTFLIQKYKIK